MSALQFPSDEKVQAAEAATETKTMRWSELHTGQSTLSLASRKLKGSMECLCR